MQAEKLKWSAVQNDDKITLQITGELSRDTLLPLWEQRFVLLSEKQIADKDILWDLSQISRIDSAGFALLCDLITHCRRIQHSNHRLIVANAPSQLSTLADLFGLTDWLNSFIA
ncbi:NTP-binding protein [Pasteurellaceae bacterium Pebbles2]|nr:NTP-binding protein [Pasteurellaceae bacterium Pebbles2]